MKKVELEKRIETFIYGILSLMFGMAFFFGVLYPDYGMSAQAYRITECREYLENEQEMETDFTEFTPREIRNMASYRIQYKSYFYERLKNS